MTDYFAMLAMELRDESVNKAEHNRQLQQLLVNRSRAAIEFKHANISAALIELGYPYIDGYKPRSNYQDLLREVVTGRLTADFALRAATEQAVQQPAHPAPIPADLDGIIVPAPVREPRRDAARERIVPPSPPRQGVNYLEIEARNASLGLAGEEFVLRVERARLVRARRQSLADRVEHVALTKGDGLGYDILSFDETGREKLVEVKTTRFGSMTPFFATRSEVNMSQDHAENFHLYRVFKFDDPSPKLFVLSGSLRQSCLLDPVQYRATLP